MKYVLRGLGFLLWFCVNSLSLSAADAPKRQVEMVTRDECIQALTEISKYPTAPFHEYRIAAYIRSKFEDLGLRVSRDDYGNIIAEYVGPNAPKKAMVVVAHMDHPAFELANKEGTKAWLLGDVDKKTFDQPVPVRVFSTLPKDGEAAEGIRGTITGIGESQLGSRTLLNLKLDGEAPASPAFGVWDIPPIEIRDNLAYMRAADDVAGCAAAVLMLQALVERKAPCRCYGVFTRAEEVGMLGAKALVREKLLPEDAVVVSVDAGGIGTPGEGPVVRVGDSAATFDREAELVLQAALDVMKEENPELKVTRKLVPGGIEASVFSMEGYCSTALGIPLGNPHNMTPEKTFAAEYLSLDDMATAVELLVRSTKYVAVDNTAVFRRRQMWNLWVAERLKTPCEKWAVGEDIREDAVRHVYRPASDFNGKTDNSGLTPKQAAKAFFTAMSKGDWDTVRTYAGTSFDKGGQHGAYEGLTIIGLGEPFQHPGQSQWFVPYEIRYAGGGNRKYDLALRNDNDRHQWEYDGGL